MNRELKGFTNAAMDRLVAYNWSGNVRELENEIERAVALAGPIDTISEEMFSEHVRGGTHRDDAIPGEALPDLPLSAAVDQLKRRMIVGAINETGSKTRAAEKLDIPRQSLQKMVKRLDLDV